MREHLVANWAVCNRLNMFIQKNVDVLPSEFLMMMMSALRPV